jgi:RNA polymerase sigma-70 factor (ECF subfamily)
MKVKNTLNNLWATYLECPGHVQLKDLFEMAYVPLYGYGLKLEGRTDLVRDAIQEVFLNLWKYRHTLSENTTALPYLLKCLRNELFRIQKKHAPSKKNLYPPDSLHFKPEEIDDDQLEKKEKKIIAQALNSLPSRQKEILYLRFFGNLRYQEISSILDINYQSVVNQSFRAISKLRNHPDLVKLKFF